MISRKLEILIILHTFNEVSARNQKNPEKKLCTTVGPMLKRMFNMFIVI